MLDEVQDDLNYALGELENIQTELATYFGTDGIILARLEGIEARLKEVTDTFLEYVTVAPGNPYAAAEIALTNLRAR